MSKYLLIIIYLVFISLGLPDSLLGSGWPVMQKDFNVDSSYAGYISMTISAMTIISALFSVYLTNKLTEKWVIIISIALCILGLILFSIAKNYWNLFIFSVPYGLGAGSIDASLNNFVAIHYSSRVMNFLHCFYGVGSMISPNVMALALKYKGWKEGYRWTAYIQTAILIACFATLSLWKNDKDDNTKKNDEKKSEQKEEDKKEEDKKDEDKKEEEKSEDIKKEIEQSSNKMLKVNIIKVEKKMNKKDRIDTEEELTKRDDKEEKETELEEKKVLSIIDVLKIKGVVFSCIAFFAYCSGEGTCFLWTSSFFDSTKEGLSKDAIASLSTTIFGGLMIGRVLSGLVSEKLGDKKLIRIGLIIEIIGIICVGIPIKTYVLAIIGYCLTSIGMGPIYPSIQHLVPILFGKVASPTIIGLQMASAYLGTTLMPYIFGLIQSKTSMWAHPIYIGAFAILNWIFIEIEFKLCDQNTNDEIGENKENIEDNNKKESDDNKKNENIQISQ